MKAASRFDLVILGAGSGGVAAARRAARHGAKVALVESTRVGGTCVNQGCIPKKIMWHAAVLADGMSCATDYGFDVSRPALDWARLATARDAHAARLVAGLRVALEGDGVKLIEGFGRLAARFDVEAKVEVEVDGLRLSAAHVLLATGARARIPAIPGAEHGITSDGFFALSERPRRVAVVGAGYIAVELGCVFASLGSSVTVVARDDGLLPGFDGSLRTVLAEHMRAAGVTLCTHTRIAAASREGASITLSTVQGGELGPFDAVLWAIGRVARTEDMGLEEAGVTVGADGRVVVDPEQRTTAPNVYALGDVACRRQSTPAAIAAGRILADRLFGGRADAFDDEDAPVVIFSHPPIGSVGLGEEAARARHGDRVRVHERRFDSLFHALSSERPRELAKLVTLGADERLLGAHVLGRGAEEIIQGFAVALKMGATKADLDRTLPVHPTAAEELLFP